MSPSGRRIWTGPGRHWRTSEQARSRGAQPQLFCVIQPVWNGSRGIPKGCGRNSSSRSPRLRAWSLSSRGDQNRNFLLRQLRRQPGEIKDLRVDLLVPQGQALVRHIQVLAAAVLVAGQALDVALLLQLGGPAGHGALVLTVPPAQLPLGDAGPVVDGLNHLIVRQAQAGVVEGVGHETLHVPVDFADPPLGGVHDHRLPFIRLYVSYMDWGVSSIQAGTFSQDPQKLRFATILVDKRNGFFYTDLTES